MIRVYRSFLLVCVFVATGCGGVPSADPLANVSVPPLPEWTDRYAVYNVGDVRFFNISKLMAGHDLTRLQAVALQNHYRDLSRAAPDGDRVAQFAEALARVQRGEFESGLDPAALDCLHVSQWQSAATIAASAPLLLILRSQSSSSSSADAA